MTEKKPAAKRPAKHSARASTTAVAGATAALSDADLRRAFDQKLGFRLIVLNNLLSRPFYAGIGARHKLAINDWRLMLTLRLHPNITATDLGQLTGLQKMAVSRSLQHMAQLNYVGAGPDPVDGRRKIVNLTRAGKAVFDDIFPLAIKREQQIRAALTEEEFAATLGSINKMIEALSGIDAET